MEFLIILFIVVSLISSIVRNIKKHSKKGTPFDPWSFDSESLDKENYLQEKRQSKEKEYFEEETEPEVSLAKQQKIQPEDELKKQTEESADLYYQEETESHINPAYQGSTKEDAKTNTAGYGELEKDLKTFLTSNKLPLGIVFSEILGPPRALKPHSYRKK
jgi:hypothetical protein